MKPYRVLLKILGCWGLSYIESIFILFISFVFFYMISLLLRGRSLCFELHWCCWQRLHWCCWQKLHWCSWQRLHWCSWQWLLGREPQRKLRCMHGLSLPLLGEGHCCSRAHWVRHGWLPGLPTFERHPMQSSRLLL